VPSEKFRKRCGVKTLEVENLTMSISKKFG
jgi:hypothetical protein